MGRIGVADDLDLLVKGFEQLAIDLRLRPLARVFDQSSRIARDLARKSNKKILDAVMKAKADFAKK